MKSTDFLNEHNAFIAQDADEMHRDQEVQMARADLYNAADYAIKLHKILRGVNDSANMEQWVMEKIAIANESLRTVYEYMNYENKEQEGAMPAFAFESAEKQFDEILEEDWKKALAGGALAASMALGGGAAHADEAPRDVPAASAQADAPVPLSKRFTPGISFPDAYTIGYNGKEYKFAGRGESAPRGEVITVPAGAVGIRGLAPVKVTLTKDGKYYAGSAEVDEGLDQAEVDPATLQTIQSLRATLKTKDIYAKLEAKKTMLVMKMDGIGPKAKKFIGNELSKAGIQHDIKDVHMDTVRGSWTNTLVRIPYTQGVMESASVGASVAGGFATGPVANAAPMQRRVKKESARYANAMKTKEPKLGKGVY